MLKRIAALLFVCLWSSSALASSPQVNVYGVDSVRNADGAFEARYHFQRRFAANDPNFPGKVDYVSKNVRVEKRGNPLKWVKKNGLEVAVTAAVVAAGYAIDELTNQVQNPVQTGEYPEGYVENKYWVIAFYGDPYYCHTQACLHDALPETNSDGWVKQDGFTSTMFGPKVHYAEPDGTGNVWVGPAQQQTCTTYTEWYCQAPDPVIENQPVDDSIVWDIVNPIADSNPDYLRDWAVDSAGNPFIYPEVQAEQEAIINSGSEPVTGAPPLPDAVVVNDPLEGQGLDPTGQPTGDPSPTPEVAKDEVPLEFPDDYAREDTLKSLRDYALSLKELLVDGEGLPEPDDPADNEYDGDVFDNLTTDMLDVADPPSLDFMPDLPEYSSSCQSITLTWNDASVDFPDASQCEKLNTAKDVIGYILYVFTAFGIATVVMRPRTFG